MDSSDEGLEKIRVRDPGGGLSETVWAEPLGAGLYRHRDVVRCAPPAHAEDFPTFLEVVEPSGNATAIVELLRKDDPRVDPLLAPATARPPAGSG